MIRHADGSSRGGCDPSTAAHRFGPLAASVDQWHSQPGICRTIADARGGWV